MARPGVRPTRRLFGLWLDGTLVGGTLYPTISMRSGMAEIGVFLAAPARGQGIVTEAVRSMVDHAFDDLAALIALSTGDSGIRADC